MSIPVLSKPPGRAGEIYSIPFLAGELWQIPTSNSVMRLLVTGEETSGDFAVLTTGGTTSDPIGFHFHREAHDVFLCLKGQMNVWANDQCRTLNAGDFASVPPGVIHQYQTLSEHTEFCGLIIPGGWEEFFRFIGEPYAGPLFPTRDHRNPLEVLVPKLVEATEKFDMIPVRDHPSIGPQPWAANDSVFPTGLEPYYLQNDKGPRSAAGGFLNKPLIATLQTDGRFSISRVEGTSHVAPKLFANGRTLSFTRSHNVILVVEGVITVTIAGATSDVHSGDTVFIPAGAAFQFSVKSLHGSAYVFCNGAGLPGFLESIGIPYDSPLITEGFDADPNDQTWDSVVESLGGKRGTL